MGNPAAIQRQYNGTVVRHGAEPKRREGHQPCKHLGIPAHGKDFFADHRIGNTHAAVSRTGDGGNNSNRNKSIEVRVAEAYLGKAL